MYWLTDSLWGMPLDIAELMFHLMITSYTINTIRVYLILQTRKDEAINYQSIFIPVLIQILLTISLFLILGARKGRAIKAGGIDRKKAALDNGAWTEDVIKVSNNLANQFQLPVIFYVLSFIFYVTKTVDSAVLILAWVFVASRILHSRIHITSNFVPHRFKVFVVGAFAIIILTILALYKVLLG